MSQCHDEYRPIPAPPGPVATGKVTQCHDVPEISVLVAGSDDSTRQAIRVALASDQRFGAITEVASGDEALDQAPLVDVVVVDLRAVSGLGALGTIHRIVGRPGRPFVVGLSRRGEEWLSLAAHEEGADDVLDWPEDRAVVADRLLWATHMTVV